MKTPVYTSSEVCEKLVIGRAALSMRCSRGRLAHFWQGTTRLFARVTIDELVEKEAEAIAKRRANRDAEGARAA